jgi:transcriptional regulator with XRE-family HTH domain
LETSEDKQELDAFYKQVGSNVKRIRKEKGLSQLKLAAILGYDSAAHIAKAEIYKYNKRFNLEHLHKMSKALNVDIGEFFK